MVSRGGLKMHPAYYALMGVRVILFCEIRFEAKFIKGLGMKNLYEATADIIKNP
jgi:hypothetical protein